MKQRESISIDSEVSKEIREHASKERRSFSGMVEVALVSFLKGKKNEGE